MELLRGVEKARRPDAPLVVNLRIGSEESIIECDGWKKRRIETHPPGGQPAHIVIMVDDQFYDYGAATALDKSVGTYDMRYAVGHEGTRCFDPRILGLADLLTALLTLEDCLNLRITRRN